jgi:hypothetical protein
MSVLLPENLHTYFELSAQACKCTGAADQGLYLRGWFREDGLRGQNLNMVLTIITINSSYTILFLIRSQTNNIIIKQTVTVKGPRKVIIKLLKLGCPSTYFQLSGYIRQ